MAYTNGKIPREALAEIPGTGGKRALAPVAEDFVDMRTEAARAGVQLPVNSAYRDNAEQAALFRRFGYPAAAYPGTSNHGNGFAVDIDQGPALFNGKTYKWLAANAHRFGFSQPAWAKRNGFNPEAWHWEHRQIRRFSGLTVDGMWGTMTTLALQGAIGASPDGSFGPATVRALQAHMNTIHDRNGAGRPLKEDGQFGPETKRLFQAYLGVDRDGNIGPATVRALQHRLNQRSF